MSMAPGGKEQRDSKQLPRSCERQVRPASQLVRRGGVAHL